MRLSPKPASIIAVFCVWAFILTVLGSVGTVQADHASRYAPTSTPSKGGASVWFYVTALRIPTYQYQDALTPTAPEDSIYPYPRLNFDKIRPPIAKNYTAVVLENQYLSVTVLPSLGGRIYRIRDRMTGRDITYRNPVIKPTQWGMRGWWLATGGIEWAFPTEEHGLNEWRPWKYRTEQGATQASVIVHDTEDRTGLIVWVKITLDATHAYLTLAPGVHNPTDTSRSFQFWLNAMLSLSKNSVSDDTHFVVPASTIRIHSTNDANLPMAGTNIDWPVYSGRDLSLYRSWQGQLGFFANPANANFAGAYDVRADQGVVRIFPRESVPGVKVFAPRGIDPSQWTDNNSGYFELWGGVTPTFWDTTTLGAGQTLEWTERWYPVSGLRGAFNYADDVAAVRITKLEKQVQLTVGPTAWMSGKVVLWLNGNKVSEWFATMSPGRPFRQTWNATVPMDGGLDLQILDKRGQIITQYGDSP